MVAEARQREKLVSSAQKRSSTAPSASALALDAGYGGETANDARRDDQSASISGSLTLGGAASGIDLAAVNDTLEAQRDEIARLRTSLSERDAELARVRESFSTNLSWFLNGYDDGQTIDLMRNDSMLLNALKSVKDDE